MKYADELELIASVTEKIVNDTSVESVLDTIIDGATDLLRCRRGSIMLLDGDSGEMTIHVARGVPEQVVAKARVKVGLGIAGGVAESGEPLLLRDDSDQGHDEERSYQNSSAICAPLKIQGKVMGVLNLNDRTDREFDEQDLRLAQLFANQASLALYNAQLVAEAEEKAQIQQALTRVRGREDRMRERLGALELVTLISNKLVASPDLDEVLASLIQESTHFVDARRGSILLYDRHDEVLLIKVSKGIPPEVIPKVRIKPGDGLAGQVFSSGEPIFLRDEDAGKDGRYTTNSAMIVPLKIRGEVLGVLNLSQKAGDVDFTDDDYVLAQIVANQATIAVYNAQVASSWMENQKMKHALEIAREIQRSFLPRESPNIDNLEIAGWSIACDEIGGDYYDYLPLGEGKVGVAIGDVSGHGIGAALLMATARAFLRAFSSEQPRDIGEMFYRVNNLLSMDTADDSFMTLFLGAFDFREHRLCYTSAGHDMPLHYRPSTNSFSELESTGIPLGMLEDEEFPVIEVDDIQSGDLFIFSTDGVWEARNAKGEFFGRERFMESLTRLAGTPATEIIRVIHKQVLEFCGDEKPHDDFSLVVVRIR